MDLFSLHAPGFVNLLASQSSSPIDVDSAEAAVNSPGLVKPAERRKLSTKEDLVLINACPQLIGSLPREWGQCKQRWGRVNAEVCRFVGSHETALKEQASGQSENDVMKTAHDIYFNDYNLKFTLEHCWRELRFDQKWRSHSQPKEKRKEAGAEAVPEEEEEVRPPGVKASKAAKRKKPNEAAYDHIHSILAEKNTISRQKILDRLLAKNIDTLSDNEVALKNKLSLKCFDVYCVSRVGAPKVKFKVNNHTYRMAYYLTDGIYPNWSTFIQSIPLPQGPKAEKFAQKQESARKDVERAFGVLQSRFAIVKNPALQWDKEKIGESSRSSKVTSRESIQAGDMLGMRREVRDQEKHARLKADLMENIWQQFGDEGE
uniref:No apical meristem-associated C-terminal domain-containing protein n=1 Tax=Brassica oleracea var. oleracea TaxID=109376 RepID=A0A0D3E2B9_BRAOL